MEKRKGSRRSSALTESQVCEAFKTYFDEMDKCARSECYWALLHLVRRHARYLCRAGAS